MDRNQALILQLHEAQSEFYAGGSERPLRGLLAEDIVWTVPGRNAIAGRYEGIDEVMDYFTRRRDIASRTFTMHPSEILEGRGNHVAALTEGRAVLDGAERHWSTVGLYRVRDRLIAACWLLPLDIDEFDRIWQTENPDQHPESREAVYALAASPITQAAVDRLWDLIAIARSGRSRDPGEPPSWRKSTVSRRGPRPRSVLLVSLMDLGRARAGRVRSSGRT